MGRGRGQKLIALAIAATLGAMFWGPALNVGHGWFPAPLDDVYIHFDYAESIGKGHPFEWIAGQGYSSGETSPLYALVLSLGWFVGFRGALMGVWAAIVAVASVAFLLSSVRRLVRPCPTWLAWLLASLPLSIGLVDWTLFSGMEVAVFAAALGRALEALAQTRGRSPKTRESRQWRLGLWGLTLVLLRPEAVVIVAVFAVIAARGAGRRSGVLAVVRSSLAGALGVLAVAGLNKLETGDWRSAGAALKLLSSNPYMTDTDRARVYVENLVAFWIKVVRSELAFTPKLLWVLPVLALGGLATRKRPLVAACVLSAIGWMALVTWNSNAPYHNFRYYVPGLLLLTIAAAITLASLPRRLAATLALVTIGLGAPRIPGQVRYFYSACANIREQHVEVGQRLRRIGGADAIVLVGDAGAIPFVSGLHAVDALGLGGYHGWELVQASVQGEASVIELIEEMPPEQQPTLFALYPNWFANLSSRFGTEIDRVTIENNVITGGPTKVIYKADWSALARPHPNDDAIQQEIDVADLRSERFATYVSPQPHGGWTTLDVLAEDASNRPLFDGGRTIPDGATESFVFAPSRWTGPEALELHIRIDANAKRITLRGVGDLVLESAVPGRWRMGRIRIESLAQGQTLTLEAHESEYRNYHIWVRRLTAASPVPPPTR